MTTLSQSCDQSCDPTREELTQKMDNKRQEITECQRTERQMEGEVHRLKEEKLEMQSRMQKRETLVSKRNDLTSQVETLEREVKVRDQRLGTQWSCDYHVMCRWSLTVWVLCARRFGSWRGRGRS